MSGLLLDFRFALRQLRKTPGFALVVVVILALGIGANTAVFSVMDSLLLRLLPVARPEGLSYVIMANGENQPPGATNTGDSNTSFSEPVFEGLRQRTDVFEELIAYVPLSFNGSVAVRHGALPEEAAGEEVSGNFFSGVSARVAFGRGFSADDEKNHAPVAVLSYDYWTRSFARDPNVLGQTIFVKGVPLTIVGVTAHGFQGIEPGLSTDFWIPLQNRPELNAWGTPVEASSLYGSPNWWSLRMMARLHPGISATQAQLALAGTFGGAIKQSLGDVDPKQWKPLLDFMPARGIAGYGREYKTPILILMALVGLVLLIACINVVMMLQARNTAREHEFSLRLAIGASRANILRQLICESFLLVAAGATLGWIFALLATRALSSWSGMETDLSPDGMVLLFTLGVAAVATFAFGLIPLWSAMRVPVAGVLRSTGPNMTANRRRILAGRIALGAQIALCLVLLVSAGLMLRTLRNYTTQSLGIDTNSLLVFGITPQGGIDDRVFYRQLIDRLRQVPGVESVSLVENRPGSGWSNNDDLVLDGVLQEGAFLRSNGVGPNFFHTMGIPVLAGRDFTDADVENTQRALLVNETFVKKYLSNTNPIGHTLGDKRRSTIIGVVRDSKYTSVDEKPMPMAYYAAMQQKSLGTMQIEVRMRGGGEAMLPPLRKTVSDLYPNVPLEHPMTQQQQFDESYNQQRMFAAMGGFFGVLAALLVATGLYGTHSFRVNRRRTEIGVRIALGASRRQVLGMVLRESFWILVGGIAVGVPLTLIAIRPLKAMLYQLSPFDPASFAAAILAMGFVSGCAVLIPARRAASIDPMRALRIE